MSSYHGCKEEAINLISHYLIDIIHKTVKPSHLEKIQIIQNINKVMFQVIFIFSDWILIKQIIVSSTLCLGGNRFPKNSTWSFEWGTGVPTRIVLMNHIVHLNTANRIIRNWTITSLKSRYLPGFLKENTVQSILSFHKIFTNLQKII